MKRRDFIACLFDKIHDADCLADACGLKMHFATFPMTDEAIDPALALKAARKEHGVAEQAIRIPAFGETILAPAKALTSAGR